MRTLDIAWLGGLFEGEGCFSLHQRRYPNIALSMTDRDTVERAAHLFKVRVNGPYKYKTHAKPAWHCQINGAAASAWMMTLYQFLSARRQEKVRSIIRTWRDGGSYRVPSPPRAIRGTQTPADCHPERPALAHGMCKECYMRKWRTGHQTKLHDAILTIA